MPVKTQNGPSSQNPSPDKPGAFKSLWYSGLHTLGTNLIATPLLVVCGIILARSLGPSGKGSYDLVIATTTLLEVLLDFSLPIGVVYVIARGDAAPGPLAQRLMLLAPCQGLAAAVLLFIVQHTAYSTALLPPHMEGQAIMAIAISLTFTVMSAYWRAILMGLQEIIKVNRLDLINRVLFFGMLVTAIGVSAIRQSRASAVVFIWIHVASLVLTSLILLHALYPALSQGKTGIRRTGLRELTAFALPCYLANFSQFLNYRLDVFMVSFFVGIEGVGLYALAVNLAQVIWLISQAAARVLLPKIAASQEAASENAAGTAQITRFTLWVSFALALVLSLCAHFMLPLIYGLAFRRSIIPFLWLLPGVVAFGMVNVLSSYIAGIGQPRVNFLISLAGLLVTLSLDLLLIPRFGITGAAIASTVSYSTSAALTTGFFTREAGINLRHILLITPEDVGLAVSIFHALRRRVRFKAAD